MGNLITLKQIIDQGLKNEEPLTILMSIMQILRSIHQREQATFEGCCASLDMWVEMNGEVTKENIIKWVDNLPEIEIPESLIDWAIDTDD